MLAYKHPKTNLPIGKEAIELGQITRLVLYFEEEIEPSQILSDEYNIFDSPNHCFYIPRDTRDQATLAGKYDRLKNYPRSSAFRHGTEEHKAYNKGYGSTGVVREGLAFGCFFFILLFVVPWTYYFLTGNCMEF